MPGRAYTRNCDALACSEVRVRAIWPLASSERSMASAVSRDDPAMSLTLTLTSLACRPGETPAGLPGPGRFNRGIQGQQVGLLGDSADGCELYRAGHVTL